MTYHNCDKLGGFAALSYWQPKLDKPFDSQYLLYIGKLLHGDLGQSLVTKNPLVDDLELKFPATLELSIMAMLVAVGIGVPAGSSQPSSRTRRLTRRACLCRWRACPCRSIGWA